MQKRVPILTMSAFILVCGGVAASAQQGPMMQHEPQIAQQQQEPGRQPHLGDWVRGMSMMGRGTMMGSGNIHSGMMMRVLFAMMDSDSDGTVSLQEFQTAHERIFKAMDINKDGVLTLEEIQAFMHGTRTSLPSEQPAQRRRPSD
jgi:hypothetical protein